VNEQPLISIVIPTISERGHWLEKCIAGYVETTSSIHTERIVITDRETCAIAWNEGIALAQGAYIHLTADDIVPHDGWWLAGVEASAQGYIPSPLILNSDGTTQSCGNGTQRVPDGTRADICRIPWGPEKLFEQIGPFPEDMHYYTDNWFTWAARQSGAADTRVKQDYLFTHHLAPERREMADERLAADSVRFQQYTRRQGRRR